MTLPPTDAGPDAAAKIRFVRRRAFAVFRAHGYRELGPVGGRPRRSGGAPRAPSPSPARAARELRTDPMASLARVYAAGPDRGRFARYMMAGTVFDGEAGRAAPRVVRSFGGRHLRHARAERRRRARARWRWRSAATRGWRRPELVVSTLGEPADLARYLATVAELKPLMCDRVPGVARSLALLQLRRGGLPRAGRGGAVAARVRVDAGAASTTRGCSPRSRPPGCRRATMRGWRSAPARFARTILELRARAADGAVVAVARGGRRDGLVAALGGPPTPAVGLDAWARARGGLRLPRRRQLRGRLRDLHRRARAGRARLGLPRRRRRARARLSRRRRSRRGRLGGATFARRRGARARGRAVRRRRAQSRELQVRDMATRETRRIPEGALAAELKRLLRCTRLAGGAIAPAVHSERTRLAAGRKQFFPRGDRQRSAWRARAIVAEPGA